MTLHSKAAIVGIEGTRLTDAERALFAKTRPFGFILFTRNCKDIHQVRSLVEELRTCVGWDCPILIDQEGGRVSRLKAPEWEEFPCPETFKKAYDIDPYLGQKKAYENALAMSQQLKDIGVNVNCTPLVDLVFEDTHDVIGDRSFGDSPFSVAFLARRVIDGHHENGIIPIMKHIPGHGRACADSHKELPRVSATLRELQNEDFQAFKLLVSNIKHTQTPMPWAMTAHLLYDQIDSANCATHSARIINDIIRGFIGFDGFLISDCLTMEALSGDYTERTERAMHAGCDSVLHCSGNLEQMTEILKAAPEMSQESLNRYVASLPDSQNEQHIMPQAKVSIQ